MKSMLNIALPKGRLGEKVYTMFENAGFGCPSIRDGSRKLVFENEELGVRYFWVKPSDVAIYVERGAADIGVAGKDILLEYRPEVYELLEKTLELLDAAIRHAEDAMILAADKQVDLCCDVSSSIASAIARVDSALGNPAAVDPVILKNLDATLKALKDADQSIRRSGHVPYPE